MKEDISIWNEERHARQLLVEGDMYTRVYSLHNVHASSLMLLPFRIHSEYS